MKDTIHPQSMPRGPIKIFASSVYRGDIAAMRAQVIAGFDLNAVDRFGQSVLEVVIRGLQDHPETSKYQMIEELIRLGADARRLTPEGFSPLFAAILNMDTEMLRILLDAGADPNAMTMDSDAETLYDWTEFDYRYEVWDVNPPVDACQDIRLNADAWLEYLDRLAVEHGKKRPDHLKLLRERGALTMDEVKKGTRVFLKIAPSLMNQTVTPDALLEKLDWSDVERPENGGTIS